MTMTGTVALTVCNDSDSDSDTWPAPLPCSYTLRTFDFGVPPPLELYTLPSASS